MNTTPNMSWARAGTAWLVLLCAGGSACAQNTPEAYEVLARPAFQTAYLKALGPKAKTPWLAQRDGPSPLPSYQDVAGTRYVMNSFCKNHDCAQNNAVMLYDPARQQVYGTVYEKGRVTLIGQPPAPVAEALAGLWKKEWRSQPG